MMDKFGFGSGGALSNYETSESIQEETEVQTMLTFQW